MIPPGRADRARENNFGFLRLLFAVLVLVSHAPELADGDRSREILTRIFGTLSFGEAAVDGFFLISGYLITMSFAYSRSTASYFYRRLARIVPAYAVCFWLCVFALAPFVGAQLSPGAVGHQCLWFLCLSQPFLAGAFQGLHYPFLNGSLWTIPYEFRCYLAVPLLGYLGLLEPRRRFWFLALVALLLALNVAQNLYRLFPAPGSNLAVLGEIVFGTPEKNIRFFAVFGVGALFHLFREDLRLTNQGALAAAALLLGLFFNRIVAETALALLGGYLVFWAAFSVPVLRASRLDNGVDISYGLYLYAWPVANLFLWWDRAVDPWLLCLLSLLGAGLLAVASWIFIEKPALDLVRKL
ncbi:MAG TPA: acyltransferase [bacterium]|nr:acyltransferase [bacterium]